jgi:hypothetical protein
MGSSKVEEAINTPHRLCQVTYTPSLHLTSLCFDGGLWVTAIELPSGAFFLHLQPYQQPICFVVVLEAESSSHPG